jgi:preprotein translocase subunit SecG
MLAMTIIAALVENPEILLVLLVLALAGLLVAVLIRRFSRHEAPSLFGAGRD